MGLKLYVWEDVMYNYTEGIAFALAETEEEARELIAGREYGSMFVRECFDTPPTHVYTTAVGYCMPGGG